MELSRNELLSHLPVIQHLISSNKRLATSTVVNQFHLYLIFNLSPYFTNIVNIQVMQSIGLGLSLLMPATNEVCIFNIILSNVLKINALKRQYLR